MDFGVPPIGRPERAGAPAGAPPARRAAPEAAPAASFSVPAPDGEHDALRAELAAAARRAEELRALGRELRFLVDPGGGQVRVEVRDLEGNVIRTIPPSAALDVAAGAPVD